MVAFRCAPIFGAEQSNIQRREPDHTRVLLFFSPVSQSGRKEAGPKEAGTKEALADFHFYGQQALKQLAKMGVDNKEVRASGFVVKVGDATTSFDRLKGLGAISCHPAGSHVLNMVS
jgi:hypothetical protein